MLLKTFPRVLSPQHSLRLLRMQICFLLKVEHIPVKPSRHLQGLVSITTSRTVSLCAVTVATSESTWLDILCSDISTLSLQVFSLLTGADPITLYRVQLPCPTSGGQSPAFESRECKPGDGKEILFVHPCRQRVCQGQCEHSARELRGNQPVNVESSGCLVTRNSS